MFLFTFTNDQPACRIAAATVMGTAKEQGANAAGAPPGAMNR